MVGFILDHVRAVTVGDQGYGRSHVHVFFGDDSGVGSGEGAHAVPELDEGLLVAAEKDQLVFEE